jgi:hypothetical protein
MRNRARLATKCCCVSSTNRMIVSTSRETVTALGTFHTVGRRAGMAV